jgi:SAM-dependent methyltransferase
VPEGTPVDLRSAWDEQSAAWIVWARRAHDSNWRFARDAFFAMLPAPGRLTVDVGCGEGRVSRDLAAAGHRVVALDGSPAMVRAAHDAQPAMQLLVADGSRLPLCSDVADLAVAYMTLQDFDDMHGAVREAARILSPGGRLCLGVVHPINSAGGFASEDGGASFVIEGSYLESRAYVDHLEREGVEMTFHSRHHSLEDYVGALTAAGFVLEALREIPGDAQRWQRVPLFLFIRAVKR